MEFTTYPSNDTMDPSFVDADVEEVLSQMTAAEKISLLAGRDWWNTVPIPRLNVPSVKVTDGPNGARGDSFFKMTAATALPNATALGATFNTELVEEAGSLLAKETKARNAVCLLAPTINIQRNPLGGRAFESFAEDPHLSGTLAASYVKGLQEGGVAATIKHFVGNDQEHERMAVNAVIPDRAFRELYLKPFMIAQKASKPLSYMTSYSKVNGTHVSENKAILQNILRDEWKFDGMVMSDWYGTYSTSDSINAGLDLEMPGAAKWHEAGLTMHAHTSNKISTKTLNARARAVLTFVQRLTKLNTDLVYAKPRPEGTRSDEQEADAALLRKIGGEALVLLKNEQDVLPIKEKTKVAIIGPNAKASVLTGGGSAQLKSSWSQTPWQGLEAGKPSGVELSYALGCAGHKFLPAFTADDLTALDGSKGFTMEYYNLGADGKKEAQPVVTDTHDSTFMFLADGVPKAVNPHFILECKGTWEAPTTGDYEFGLCVTGAGKLFVNDELVVSNFENQTPGEAFFGSGTIEEKGSFKVEKGKKYSIKIEFDTRAPSRAVVTPLNIHGLSAGFFPKTSDEELIAQAAKLAKSVDVPVLVVGLNKDWESEGYDRPNLSLPLNMDKLIASVAAANSKTVVVIQAGSCVSMPWLNDVASVVYAWYGGNETGNVIADVIYGKANPSGRSPLSFPKREQDIAAHLNFKSAKGRVVYEEGIWVGYKHHNARAIEPLFPFGHGLSYTTFEYSDLKITSAPPKKIKSAEDFKLTAQITVTNTGKVAGSHSVHFYTSPPPATATSYVHPDAELRAFTKVTNLGPREKKTVEVTLDKYAVSHWDDQENFWTFEQGEWQLKVGKDASNLDFAAPFTVDGVVEWRGL